METLKELKKENIQALLNWYQKKQRPFPWRKNPQPYWVWLAEIMSQQTQMATLLPYFYRFIQAFPTVQHLANAHVDAVLKCWAGLGYYSRARNIHRCAQIIAQQYEGIFPKTYEEWLALPGIGPYTAAAIVSQCFKVKEPVWDGNVIRVCSRLECRKDAYSSAFKQEMLSGLKKKIQDFDPSLFNQSLMELGACLCTPKKALCMFCPIQESCKAYQTHRVDEFPPAKIKPDAVEIKCKVHVWTRQEGNQLQVLMKRRKKSEWYSDLWDFDSELGGKCGPVKTIAARPTQENRFRYLGKAKHTITHHKIELESWHCTAPKEESHDCSEGEKWVNFDELFDEHPPIALSTTAKKVLKLMTQQN